MICKILSLFFACLKSEKFLNYCRIFCKINLEKWLSNKMMEEKKLRSFSENVQWLNLVVTIPPLADII